MIDWPDVFETAFLGTGDNDDFPSEEITYTQNSVDLTITCVIHEGVDDAPTQRMHTNVSRLELKISLDDLSQVRPNDDKITRDSGKVYTVQGIIKKTPMCWHIVAASM